jgi:7-cyano-7-deazaguanine reductase
MTSVASFVIGNNKDAFFFCPMRLRSLDSGRLFSAKIAFRIKPFTHLYSGDFAEPFSPPLRASLRARRSSLRRAPQGVPHPLTRGRVDDPAPALTDFLESVRAYASHNRLAVAKTMFVFICRDFKKKSRQKSQLAHLSAMLYNRIGKPSGNRIMPQNMENKRFDRLTLLAASERRYPKSPDEAKLECFDNLFSGRDYVIEFDCPEFTSLCPVTGQPDFGHIVLRYVPDKLCIESKSLKLYLYSFRNHPTFHEEVVNTVLDAVVAACSPRRAEVVGRFRPRGGISINVKAAMGGKIDE